MDSRTRKDPDPIMSDIVIQNLSAPQKNAAGSTSKDAVDPTEKDGVDPTEKNVVNPTENDTVGPTKKGAVCSTEEKEKNDIVPTDGNN